MTRRYQNLSILVKIPARNLPPPPRRVKTKTKKKKRRTTTTTKMTRTRTRTTLRSPTSTMTISKSPTSSPIKSSQSTTTRHLPRSLSASLFHYRLSHLSSTNLSPPMLPLRSRTSTTTLTASSHSTSKRLTPSTSHEKSLLRRVYHSLVQQTTLRKC
jgi:hypothetical protein